MKRRFPLHIHISTLFLALLLIVGGVIGGLGYKISSGILKSTANELSERIGREALREFANIIAPAEMATRLLSLDAVTQATSLEQRLENLGFMREALSNSSELTSLYVGYGNGDSFLVRRIANEAERNDFAAPEQTDYIVQSIDHEQGILRGRYIFLDSALATLRSDDRPDYASSYDPRTRNWYKAALIASGQIKTPPYLFFTTKKVGTTIANRAGKGDAVVGADIRLETLDQTLAQLKVTPGTQIAMVNRSGLILAHENNARKIRLSANANDKPVLANITDYGVPVLAQLAPIVRSINSEIAQNLMQEVDGELWHVSVSPLKLEGANTLFLITAIPDDELMAAAHTLMRHSFIVMALVILLAIPITWALARAVSQPLRKLAGEADAIRHFEFSKPISVESNVLEVSDLAQTMDSMKHTISRFLDISLAVAAENNFERLLPHLLSETISAADADAGVLYLTDEDKLLPATGLMADGSALPSSAPVVDPAASSPLFSAAMAARTAHSARLTEADIQALDLAEAIKASGATHAIAVPLLNRQQNLVGAMVLLRLDETDDARLSFIGALSGSAAVSLEAKELIQAQKQLFEAMIKLIAGAIDAKSAYTGGHCARVPVITKMLARAACDQTTGLYKDFHLSEDEWEAVHVAAWLHDCGKVTTPEYVVDKATKLETLYDRIHEIRMRFEVLKRDAEITCLKSITTGEPEATARAKLAAALAQLDDDFSFVATSNEGGEFMAPEKQDRLKTIAARTWLRTLDDRIGISHEENERKARSPAPDLPVSEALLADKPEHLFGRQAQDRIAPDNKWGFKMQVPELLYNKGELYNLSVARGTLSEEERYKINEHIVQTLIMLSALPFPKHLRNVPEIASGHHEKMDGTGYPKRLRGEEMSPLARMMAVADIFEALTAVDRPYKKGKTLSEAIKIMSLMKKDQHIDPDLFDLFLRSGVYREYAERYMRPEQIDAVDIEAYVEKVATN
ncbi:HD domain-containing phosphohydrolase [Propionivibrio sp.]|uniref:HD domain-containing phosphohydrolase n=1 Tax=Propionivibrio sp. TaxID=2212460 RepID=UPI003BF39155